MDLCVCGVGCVYARALINMKDFAISSTGNATSNASNNFNANSKFYLVHKHAHPSGSCLLYMAALSPRRLHFKPRGSPGHCPLFSIDLLYHQLLIYHNLAIPGINLTSKPTVTPSLNTENNVCSFQLPLRPSVLCRL